MAQQGDQPVRNETKEVSNSPTEVAQAGATALLQEEATGLMAGDSEQASNFGAGDQNATNQGDNVTEDLESVNSSERLAEKIRREGGAEGLESLVRTLEQQRGEKPEVKDGKLDCPDCQKDVANGDDPLKGARFPNSETDPRQVDAEKDISNGEYEREGRRVAALGSAERGQDSTEAQGDQRLRASQDGQQGPREIDAIAHTGDRAPEDSIQRVRDGGDGNVVREYDDSRDSEAEVKRKFSEMAREKHPGNAEGMIESFNKSFDTMNAKLSPEQMQEIRRNMSVMMESGRMSKRLTANTVVDHAAKVADAVDGHGEANAFAQGPNPTCNLTSQARLEAQRDPVKYSNKAASLVSRGGAWTGGENGTAASWTQIDSSNFTPDAEASESYNASEKQYGGERGMAGKLDDALRGQQMADNSTESRREAGTLGSDQNLVYTTGHQKGGALSKQGTYMHTKGADGSEGSYKHMFGSADSTLENVAQSNYQEGLGGLLVSESFKGKPGTQNLEKYGARFFKGVDGLKAEAAKNPGEELQIATNGSMILGRPGHGLHAQTVRSEKGTGDLVFGNNWTARHNNQKYNDAFVDKFTDPAKSHHGSGPVDGGGRGDGGSFDKQNWGNRRMDDDDYIKNYKEEQEKQKQELEQKEKEEEEEEKGDKNPEEQAKEDGKDIEAQGRFAQQHSDWLQRRNHAEANKLEFSEKEPVLADFLGK